MGLTKADLFTPEQNELACLAKAFAHPARVAIIEHLLKSNRCINGDLVNELGLAQATISQHLKELKNIGLIQGNIEGVSMSYCINTKKWNSVQQLFNTMFDRITNCGIDDCC
ncbi:ArsR/SmtB family transcription factor [Christiangramia sabulilitoris]|uniref:Winged helix-turn-helix transcriptional regulator n=1 Tax=Christiangramia sabulilitoris TaxID=2583991 RepID=A0A550I362_9FLAO|nr:metalloregulator ArsR/SmtB family transcription factor [Christiangramia sabulilitoris]TRO65248.1 winged helix-turn-helix transcriptional regulator [Christiangramia sabulilitoris]